MFASLQNALFFAASTSFVRAAIRERADLSPFRGKPTLTVLAGVFCIVTSFPLGWPAVVFFGYLSIHWHNPWLAAVVGPAVYAFSHLLFLFGIWLSGMTYTLAPWCSAAGWPVSSSNRRWLVSIPTNWQKFMPKNRCEFAWCPNNESTPAS